MEAGIYKLKNWTNKLEPTSYNLKGDNFKLEVRSCTLEDRTNKVEDLS